MERNKNGEYTNKHTPIDIIDAMKPGQIYATGQLASLTEIPHRTTLKYCNELAETGQIEKRMPNTNTAIWIRYE